LLVPAYFLYRPYVWLPWAVDGMLMLAALIDFFAGPPTSRILLERPLPFPLAVDRTNEVAVEITNRTGKPVRLVIKDDVPARCETRRHPIRTRVNPGRLSRVTYGLIPLERGAGRFGNIHFWVNGPLGLVWKKGEQPAEFTAKLYPGLALIEERKMKVRRPLIQDAVRPYWKRGGGAEFDSLREYEMGDDHRLIHWKTTARMGKLVVRLDRLERSQNVFMVLDAGRMMTARVLNKTKLDYALNTALLVAHTALELGDKVGLMVVGQDVLAFVPPSNAPDQLGRMLDSTYAIQPKLEEPRFYLALSNLAVKLRRRSLVMVFTDLIDERASEGLIRYSLGLLPRHLPLVVTMSDTEVIRVADSIPLEKGDLYRKGVAAEMLQRRGHLLARLRSAGMLVIDTPPDQISISVLERYLDIKTRNLL